MRRLGIVAGILGGCVGLVIAGSQIWDLLRLRDQHKKFQSLTGDPVVQESLKNLQDVAAGKPPTFDWFQRNAPAPPAGYKLDPPATLPAEFYTAAAAISGSLEGWPVNKGGVAKIYFGSDKQINVIELDGGYRISDTTPQNYTSIWLSAHSR
jgi:hypothetical protein